MLIKKIFKAAANKPSLHEIISKAASIRKHNSIVAICSSVTGYNWMGVNRATHSWFPDNTIVLPQYYSETVYSEDELRLLCNEIAALHFDQIILSGFPEYFEKCIYCFLAASPDSAISIIYHGMFTDFSDPEELKKFKKIIGLVHEKKIKKIGYVKKEMLETCTHFFKHNGFELLLKTPVKLIHTVDLDPSRLHCGLLLDKSFRKNLYNQMVAALMIKDACVHLTGDANFFMEYAPDRIISHSLMDEHDLFLSLLGSMNINFHVTFSESWGQIVTESLAAGVPCLTGNMSRILDFDDTLKKDLTVQEADNPLAISKKALEVLNNREAIANRAIPYIQTLNNISESHLKKFIDA